MKSVEWNNNGRRLKTVLLGVAEEVCERAKGLNVHKETWWWNEDVEKAVEQKRKSYKAWVKGTKKTKENKVDYFRFKKLTKRVIARVKEAEQKRLGEDLDKQY